MCLGEGMKDLKPVISSRDRLVSETGLCTVRYLFANPFSAISSKILASTNFRSLSDAIE